MPRILFGVLAALLVPLCPLLASSPVSREDVLDAIHSFEANATGDYSGSRHESDKNREVARASNTILRYSLESDDVVVDLGLDAVPWCDLKKGLSELKNSSERGLLLGAYLAGSVKAQLETGKQDPNPYAGWVAMLKIYRALKVREELTIPEADTLLAHQNDGSLEAFARESAERSREKLRKRYGEPNPSGPAGPAKP